MRPDPLQRQIVRGDHLVIEGRGEWYFEDEKIVFIDETGNFSALERPDCFSLIAIDLYHHGPNVVGFDSRLWLFARDGRIKLVKEVERDKQACDAGEPIFDAFYAWESDLVFVSDIGAYLFRDGALAWSVRFCQHGILDFDRADLFRVHAAGPVFQPRRRDDALPLVGRPHRLKRWNRR